jgi:hypothetical protein
MQGAGIGIRIHGNGGDTHVAAGANDAAGNFAAIGNQNFAYHCHLQWAVSFQQEIISCVGAFN